jgi:hypothetical protein
VGNGGNSLFLRETFPGKPGEFSGSSFIFTDRLQWLQAYGPDWFMTEFLGLTKGSDRQGCDLGS